MPGVQHHVSVRHVRWVGRHRACLGPQDQETEKVLQGKMGASRFFPEYTPMVAYAWLILLVRTDC